MSGTANEPKKELLDVLDDTASAIAKGLYKQAEAKEDGDYIDLAKAFAIVAEYAEGRAKSKAADKPKEKSRVAEFRDRFNGAETSGRGNARKIKAASNGAGGGTAVDAA